MKQHKLWVPASARQMSLMFEPSKVEGMTKLERAEVSVILAQILMQAAGLVVEELEDDQR